MPLSNKLAEKVCIIPVHSHAKAKKYVKQFRCAGIIYYIKDLENQSDPLNPKDEVKLPDDLFIYYSENKLANDPGTQLMQKEEIFINKKGHYLFNSKEYRSITELLKDNNIPNNLVLKQHIIASYLNSLPVNFESTFFLTKGKQYPPESKWKVNFPHNSYQGTDDVAPTSHKQYEITMQKTTELIFSNCDQDFLIYLKRVNELLKLELTCETITTTYYADLGPVTTHYWQVDAHHYHVLMEHIIEDQHIVPTLKNLVFNRIFREKNTSALAKNYQKHGFFDKDKTSLLPVELLDDPRMSAHRKEISLLSKKK